MSTKNGKKSDLAQTYQFYLLGVKTKKQLLRQNQRVRFQLDFDDKGDSLKQVIQGLILLHMKIKDRYGNIIKNENKIRKWHICDMQAQICQMLILCIKHLDMLLIGMPKTMIYKRRAISKKRVYLKKELKSHKIRMRGEGKRVYNKYSNTRLYFEFYNVMNQHRRT